MTRHKGSGLVEYALPLSLVGLVVGLGVYAFADNNNLLNFFISTTDGKYNSSDKSITIGQKSIETPSVYSQNPTDTTPTIIPSGTPSVVVESTCNAGTCDIDFGSFTLTGVPENFGDYVKANGTSGGIDILASLIMQVAEQVEVTDPTIANDIKDLANLGHFMAMFPRENEEHAKSAIENDEPNLYKAYLEYDFGSIHLPDNVSHLLPDYTYLGLGAINALEKIKIIKTSDPDKVKSCPGAKFQKLSEKINSSKLLNEQKKVVKILSNIISNIIDKHIATTTDKARTATELEDVVAPKTSVGTDVRSALICTTGNNSDNGSECN